MDNPITIQVGAIGPNKLDEESLARLRVKLANQIALTLLEDIIIHSAVEIEGENRACYTSILQYEFIK